jgi:ABC-type multidrug transport system ATPase subunit
MTKYIWQVLTIHSGSGKTTLLNVLAHRAGVPTDLSTFRKLSCYVEQEDALVGSLTVRETLYFAAQLGLPRYADASSSLKSR